MESKFKYQKYYEENHLKHTCLHCGKPISLAHLSLKIIQQYSSCKKIPMFCNSYCAGAFRFSKKGENHPSYKNGSGSGYSSVKSAELMIKLGNQCKCGATENLIIHYKDGDRTNQVIENAEVMCRSCKATLIWKTMDRWASKEEQKEHYKMINRFRKREAREKEFFNHFGTRHFVMAADIIKRLKISRERVRQLRIENKLKYVKIGGLYFYFNWYKGERIR